LCLIWWVANDLATTSYQRDIRKIPKQRRGIIIRKILIVIGYR
jgi:hypothetical protein